VPEDPADLLTMTFPQWRSRFCAAGSSRREAPPG
jgi:hypothetical protein